MMPDTDWMADARCAAEYGSSFDRQRLHIQIACCVACPVRIPCLVYAVTIENGRSPSRRDGVWGGMSVNQRRNLDRAIRS